MSDFAHTPEEVRQMIRELEDTHADVIAMSAHEIATHKDVVYWHARRTRMIEMIDILNWALGDTTDKDKYPCMKGWSEELSKAGISPWAENKIGQG